MIALVRAKLEPEDDRPEDHEDEQDVHDRVGDGHGQGRRYEGGVVDLGAHHEIPHEPRAPMVTMAASA